MKVGCIRHGRQGLVALGERRFMCVLCYNHMLRTGDSEDATIVDGRSRIFEEAATLWEEMDLPVFEVKGWMDGRNMKWDIPGVLREAARRIREGID